MILDLAAKFYFDADTRESVDFLASAPDLFRILQILL